MRKNKWLGSLLVFLILAIGGCKPKQNNPLITGKVSSDFQVTVWIMNELKVAPKLQDRSYQLVDKSGVRELYNNYRQELFNKGITKWDQKFDCNRFTLTFQAFAQIHYFTKNSGNAESIAVGEIYYTKDKEGGHAINILLTPTEILFFEPQSGDIINLSKTERESITFVKF